MKLTKCLMTIIFAMLCMIFLPPAEARAAVTFEDIPVYVVDDMRDYDQVVGLSWSLDWSLNREAGVTEQCRNAKFSLAKDSFVRIKMAAVNQTAFSVDNYFRLYGNETMAVPLTDNNIGQGNRGDDYFFLKAGTYYVQCGAKLFTSFSSNHSTKIMIGAVPEDKALQIEKTASADRKKMTVTVTQKFATKLGKARWCKGKVTSMVYDGQDMDNTNSFTVDKNGWYTIYFKSQSSAAFNKDVEYYKYIYVTGIGEGAKKGVTYKSNNLKYKLVKKGFDGTGTVMVTGMVKNKANVTIPQTVNLKGHDYKVVKINSNAFYKKSRIKNITIKSTTISSIGKNAFKGIHKKAVFKVPREKYKAYQKLLTAKTGFLKRTMKIKK